MKKFEKKIVGYIDLEDFHKKGKGGLNLIEIWTKSPSSVWGNAGEYLKIKK